MKIINVNNGKVIFLFSKKEFGILHAVSSHVLYEFAMGENYDLTASTKWTKNEAAAFAENLRKHYDAINDDKIEYTFSNKELRFIITIIKDSVRDIDWEFPILTGYTVTEALELKDNIQKAIDN